MSSGSSNPKRKRSNRTAVNLRHLGQKLFKRARTSSPPPPSASTPGAGPSNTTHIAGQSSSSGLSGSSPGQGLTPSQQPTSTGAITSNPNPAGSASLSTNVSASKFKNKAWKGLESALQALHISAEAIPPLQSAVDGLVSCLDIVEAAARHRRDYEELALTLESVAELLKEHLQDSKSAQLNSKILNISQTIDKEIKQINERQQRSRSQQAFRASDDEEDVIKRCRRIGNMFNRILMETSMSAWSIANDHLVNTRLENMSPAKLASFNSKLSMAIGRRTCTENTRKEVLSELDLWSDNLQAEAIYWMNGMAGTGKTTIACSLATALESRGQLGASFFCTRSSPECRDADRIIPTLAYQLARYSTPFQSALCRVLNDDPDVSTRNISTQFERLLKEPLLEVKDKLPNNLVVVIDALDECDDDQIVGLMLDMLFRFAASLPIKFFVTSRPEPTIHGKIMKQTATSRSVLHLHEIERSLVQADIELYLHEELAFMSPTIDEVKRLAELSDNLFIYAATAVRYIRPGKAAADPRERLATMLSVDSRSKQKHSAIDTLYSAILSVTLNDEELEPKETERVKLVLWTAVCAQEPVGIETLGELAGLASENQVLAALQPLRSVLHVSENNSLVSTLHMSFLEYMFSRERSAGFFCDKAGHNELLASGCFKVMTDQLRFNICHLESSFVLDADVANLSERINTNISSTLHYVCRYWGDHLELTCTSDYLSSALHNFLLRQLLFWMEVLNLKQCMTMGTKGLLKAQSWLATAGASPDLQKFIGDAHKFIASFMASSASLSTPHIYISALPFSPKSSFVFTHYQIQFQGLMEVKGTAMALREGAAVAIWTAESQVHSAAYSPDGTQIASSCSDHSIQIYNAHNGTLVVGPIEGHTGSISSIQFSPDGTRIISGSHDHTIRVWSSRDGTPLGGPFEGHTDWVNSVGVSPEATRIVSGSRDHTIRIWNAHNGALIGEPIDKHTDSVESVQFSPDGTRILSGSRDRTICIWNAHDGSHIVSLDKRHIDPILSVAFSPDGEFIVSGSDKSGIVCVWNTRDMSLAAGPFQDGITPANSVGFSPNGAYIVSGSGDGTVHVWHVRDGQLAAGPFEGHTDAVASVGFSPDGTHIISSSEDCTIRIWNTHDKVETVLPDSIEGHTDFVASVGFSPDGTRVVSGSNDGTICVWDACNGTLLVGPIQGHTWTASSLGLFLDDTHIDSDPDDPDDHHDCPICDCPICTWNASVHDEQHVVNPFETHGEPITSVRFSPEGRRIISGSYDGTIYAWDAFNGKKISGPFEGHSDWVTSIAFSPDGKLISSGSSDHTIGIWNAHDGALTTGLIEGHTNWVTSVKFSPNGTQIVSGSRDHTIRVWSVLDGTLITGPIQCGTSSVNSVGFSPEGTRIVSGCSDGTICVWNVLEGTPLVGPFEGHGESVTSVAFSPSGTHIVSGSKDSTIRIWSVNDGNPATDVIEGHTDAVESVEYSPDGTRIVSGSGDGTVRVWQLHDNPPADPTHEEFPASAWLVGALPDNTYVVSGSGGCIIRASSGQAVCTTRTCRKVLWTVRRDGWFMNRNSQFIFWVPPELRCQFPTTGNLVTIGGEGSLEVDFSRMLLGDQWQECYLGANM